MASLSYKLKLLRGLLSGDNAKVGPFLVLVDTTSRCNLRCPGCRYHSPQLGMPSAAGQDGGDFSPLLFERLCDQLATMGTKQIILTGEGEPFLHPDLVRLVSASSKRAFHTTLYTNGTLLDGERVRRIIAAGLDVLIVSLWAGCEEDYRRNYPDTDPGMFQVVVENLRRLSALKTEMKSDRPSVRLYQPINRMNFENVHRMADLAHETECNELFFSPFRTRHGKLESLALRPDEVESLCLSLRQLEGRLDALAMRNNIAQVLLRYRIGEKAWEKTPCYVGWLQAQVKPDGTVSPCKSCEMSMGNMENETFAEIWNGPAFRKFRRQVFSRAGLEGTTNQLDCGFCGQLPDNLRIHHIFKWFSFRAPW